MTIQLRQICLVARELAPVVDDLTSILGINSVYGDEGVGHFGLENNLMAVGRNFLEVVAPIQENTAGGRYLDRRGGDGGYMVITQIDTFENQQAIRTRAVRDGNGYVNYVKGANVGGFVKVADAVLSCGVM